MAEFRINGKGGRTRTIYTPPQLVEETHWYILANRPNATLGFENSVFLNARGRSVSKKSLSEMFRKSAKAIGSDATLHHLRHTFAVTTLRHLQQSANQGNDVNPLKTVQVLLGHSSLESTEIYLRALELQRPEIEESLSFLYGADI